MEKGWKDQSGETLISVIIAASIGAIIIGAIGSSLSGLLKVGNKADSNIDAAAVKAKILATVDCEQTQPMSCTNGSYMDLKNRNGNAVISNAGGRIGKFFVRAKCINTTNVQGIEVRAAWLTPAGENVDAAKQFSSSTNATWFKPDEVNHDLLYNWEHPRTLLFPNDAGGGALLCAMGRNGFVPIGSIFHVAGNTAPFGFLKCNGDVIPNGLGTVQGRQGDFSALYSILGSTYGAMGKLPDMRGEFIRGFDDGRGIDPARVRGQLQLDQFQGHRNLVIQDPWGGYQTGFQAWSSEGSGTANGGGAAMRQKNVWDQITSDGTNGVPRFGKETRPRNISFLTVIKY